MLKSDLIQRIASQNPHLYQRDIEKIFNAIFDEIVEALRRGGRVELRGFGAFSAKLRAAREGRNPRTGAVVSVAKKAVPYFKMGKEMRERLNRESVAGQPSVMVSARTGGRAGKPSTGAVAEAVARRTRRTSFKDQD